MDLVKIDLEKTSAIFIQQTINQLRKDFQSSGIELKIKKEALTYQGLFTIILDQVIRISSERPSNIERLLYRIDLSEEQIRSGIQKSSLSFPEALSELIIKRELYKVIIRNQ